MNKYTFGNGAAAIYLADYLSRAADEYVQRKVSAKLTTYFKYLNEFQESNLPKPTKIWAIRKLIEDFDSKQYTFTLDPLIPDLMRNIAYGRGRHAIETL